VILSACDGDVEESAFFFEVGFVLGGAGEGEEAFRQMDDEDGFPFESFGLVDGGEAEGVGVGFGVFGAGHINTGKECELGEEFFRGVKLT